MAVAVGESGNQRTTDRLIASVGEYWSRITGHPFITAVASARLDEQAFARWIAADYAFNLHYLRFSAGVLSSAPDLSACRVLGRQVQREQAVLDLLIATAERSSVALDVEPGPFTLGLSSYLRALLAQGYEVCLAALYGAERVYYDAWSAVAPQSSRSTPYWPLIQLLCSEDAADNLSSLGGLLDDATPHGPTPAMVEAIEMIVRFELLFWSEVYVGASW